MNIAEFKDEHSYKPLLFTGFLTEKAVKILLACSFLIIIFFLINIINSSKEISQKNTSLYFIEREVLLNQAINLLQHQNNFLETEIFILNNKLLNLMTKKEDEKVDDLALLLGAKNYTEGGIEIILQDNKNFNYEENAQNTIIHNNDLLQIINLLWSLNAKAISINGERVLFDTEISCIGPTIMINKKIIIPPFYIQAGGNSEDLLKIADSSVVLVLKYNGIDFSVKKMDNVNIPSTRKSLFKEEG